MKDEEQAVKPLGQELEGRSLLVLYGTETGHSKEIAEEIVEAAERLRFQASIQQMNDVSLVSHHEQVFPGSQRRFDTCLILTIFNNNRKKWSSTPSQSLLPPQQARAMCLPMPACSGRAC